MKVATVVGVAQTVTEDTSNIDSDVDELTVKGTGFDAGTATASSIKFNGADIVRATIGFEFNNNTYITCCVVHHLSPSDEGDLGASVTVDTNFTSGNDVKVATVVAVAPTVMNDNKFLSSDSMFFTVIGKGFNAKVPPKIRSTKMM